MEEAALESLQRLFVAALAAAEARQVDRAEELLRAVLRQEPRLPEPRLELARLHLEAGRLDDAEQDALEAIGWLEQGGRWLDELTDEQELSLAHNLVGEALRQKLDDDEVVFGDAAVYTSLLERSKRHFKQAAQLDPDNAHAAWHDQVLDPGASGEQD